MKLLSTLRVVIFTPNLQMKPSLFERSASTVFFFNPINWHLPWSCIISVAFDDDEKEIKQEMLFFVTNQ